MGSGLSLENRLVKALEEEYHLRNVKVHECEGNNAVFTTDSAITLAKREETLGIIVDDEHFYYNDNWNTGVFVEADINGEKYFRCISLLWKHIKTNVSEKQKVTGECTLIFRINTAVHGTHYVKCRLDERSFEYEFTLLPEYNVITTI